jgi:carboxypeptidase Q
MRRRRGLLVSVLPFVALAASVSRAAAQTAPPAWLDAYREPAARLIGAALADRFAWERLARLTDTIGNRLSGTPQLDRAIRWAADEMRRDGLENVHTERVMVPHWVRGAESAEIVAPAPHALVMLGLGNSVGTPAGGVQAEVVVVHSFEELDAAGARVRGRIVLFNVPYTSYGDTVRFRSAGPSRAAKLGAVAMLIRSVGNDGLRTMRRRFLRRRSRRRMPTASSAWRIAATASSCGSRWRRTSSPTPSRPTSSASCAGANGPTKSCS